VRIISGAEGLDFGPALEVLVDDTALAGIHRIELDLGSRGNRFLGRTIGPFGNHFLAASPVTGGIDDDPLSFTNTAESRLESQQLKRIDGLAATSDQQAVVLVTFDRGRDDVIGFLEFYFPVEIESI